MPAAYGPYRHPARGGAQWSVLANGCELAAYVATHNTLPPTEGAWIGMQVLQVLQDGITASDTQWMPIDQPKIQRRKFDLQEGKLVSCSCGKLVHVHNVQSHPHGVERMQHLVVKDKRRRVFSGSTSRGWYI